MPIIQKFMEALRGVGTEEYVKGLLLCFGAQAPSYVCLVFVKAGC